MNTPAPADAREALARLLDGCITWRGNEWFAQRERFLDAIIAAGWTPPSDRRALEEAVARALFAWHWSESAAEREWGPHNPAYAQFMSQARAVLTAQAQASAGAGAACTCAYCAKLSSRMALRQRDESLEAYKARIALTAQQPAPEAEGGAA